MFSKVLSLDKLSCRQIWNIEQEKDSQKEEAGGRPAKLNERSRARVKNKGHIFLLEEHENFVAAVSKLKMLAATNARMSGSDKKVNENTSDISSIKRVTPKFLQVFTL